MRTSQRTRQKTHSKMQPTIQSVQRKPLARKKPGSQRTRKRKPVVRTKRQKRFRFLDLPLEIRSMIYGHCLTSPTDITIQIHSSNGIKAILRENVEGCDDLVELRSYHNSPGSFNAGIIRVSRSLYQEAAPILYARNTFKFEVNAGANYSLSKDIYDGLDAFRFFQHRLTAMSRENVRVLDLKLPAFKRFTCGARYESLLRIPDEQLFATIGAFPRLGTVHLRLYEDVLRCDLSVLSKINDRLGNVNVILHSEQARSWNRRGVWDRRFRMSADIVAHIRQWRWELDEEIEKVD
jgi:hypothetical protein